MKEIFINNMHNKKKIYVSFFSKEDGCVQTRLCAPMDYGPSSRAANKNNRFHMWDYESDKKNHPLSLLPDQITDLKSTNESFEPEEFVTWEPKWIVPRNWGKYS